MRKLSVIACGVLGLLAILQTTAPAKAAQHQWCSIIEE
jgi:hypothetical protein